MFTTVTMSAYQDQLNAGFLKVCEVHDIYSFKDIQEFEALC